MTFAIASWLLLALPIQARAPKATCTFFVLKDCPIANRYAPEMQRIAKDYGAKGIQFVLEYEDQDLSLAAAQEHAKAFGIRFRAVVDQGRVHAVAFKVRVSPTAVLRSGSSILYRGRIDDAYAAVGKPRAVKASRDLRDALDAFLAGKPIQQREVPAVGCHIF